jgi:predicted metal-dependent TIM-barrel fold hydrolase
VTVGVVASSGCWMGFSVYPDTKMDEHRVVAVLREFGVDRMIVNSAADWGRSDPVATYRVGRAMLEAGFDESEVDKVLWRNPVEFYGRSGRLVLDELPGFRGAAADFGGNSVLRGVRG